MGEKDSYPVLCRAQTSPRGSVSSSIKSEDKMQRFLKATYLYMCAGWPTGDEAGYEGPETGTELTHSQSHCLEQLPWAQLWEAHPLIKKSSMDFG